MALNVVVAFRMWPAGMAPGPEGSYLSRARSLCIRGEVVGGRMLAWSTTSLALGWDIDAIDEAIDFAVGIREESQSPERAWACALVEGELEWLSPDGEGILAWGPALLAATALAQVARAGEVLLDGQVSALRAGRLSLRGVRASADVAQTVRGWRLDLEHPWKVPHAADDLIFDATKDAGGDPKPVPLLEQISALEWSAPTALSSVRAHDPRQADFAARIRTLTHGVQSAALVDALADLRQARARAEGGPGSVRCHASLALALTLSIAGRVEEALLEALDALARARETHEPKAIGACLALLAKLYAGVGYWDAATALRGSVAG